MYAELQQGGKHRPGISPSLFMLFPLCREPCPPCLCLHKQQDLSQGLFLAKILDSSSFLSSEPSKSLCSVLRLTAFDFVVLGNFFYAWKGVLLIFDLLVLGVVASLAGCLLKPGWTVKFQSPLPRCKHSLVSWVLTYQCVTKLFIIWQGLVKTSPRLGPRHRRRRSQ